jgi:hypothetical protein
MKTTENQGFLPTPNAMGRSVAVKTPVCFQNTNKINGFVHVFYGTALLILLNSSILCLEAQPLPNDWWQQGDAEAVLRKAQSITHSLSYFCGRSEHVMNDPDASIALFTRRLPNGIIESKDVYHKKKVDVTMYTLEGGTYYFSAGKLIHTTYSDSDKEQLLAAKCDHPYDYRLLNQETIGTNDCLVVAQIYTPHFGLMIVTNAYPGYTPTNDDIATELIQYMKIESDIYIRKADGVIIGKLERNKQGEVMNDRLYKVVKVNQPIPMAEFALPMIPAEVATNSGQLMQIVHNGISQQGGLTSRENIVVRVVVLGCMVISLGVLCYIIIRFHPVGGR